MTDDKELIANLRMYADDGYPYLSIAAADRIEALTKERDAARQDAKAAEDELEMQEQEACMMENDYIKLEKERDALEAKLAKAVEALGAIVVDDTWGLDHDVYMMCRTTLAEIKGESHE